ncbi:hypothetical protein DDE82_006097 [Stemphylium lycopersici]|nr:hypothetical protein DDE82_006097 [Stemphylium lycopersici]
MAAMAKNNAFGPCSPSWNLSFPDGNLTAAEILAYLPHWLKSIDVIDRLISHGGKSPNIAAMINEFRDVPENAIFKPNSVMIMMEYAMRRAVHEDWTVTTHFDFVQVIPRSEGDLNVKNFRTPRITHPKSVRKYTPKSVSKNEEVPAVEFKNLAIHVKKHPGGSDALDLARCVQYALKNQDEVWLFPTDFQRLITHLGGPMPVTHAHHDRHVLARRNHVKFPLAKPSPQQCRTSKRKAATPRSKANAGVRLVVSDIMSHSGTRKEPSAEDLGQVFSGSKRRSGRLVGKNVNFAEESEMDPSDKDTFDPPYTTPAKYRKLTRIPPIPDSSAEDGDFVGEESEPDDDVPEEDEEDISDKEEEFVSPSHAVRSRKAARKARVNIKASFLPEQSDAVKLKMPGIGPSPQKTLPAKQLPSYMTRPISPDIMSAARLFLARKPILLRPPMLSANRLKIDHHTIYLYSSPPHTSFEAMYASAFDSARFNGPRRSPPFRELHRLSDPEASDCRDWAENIRWAKEQWKEFGSVWTEYDYHLECITEHRREVGWVSEEAIVAAMV